MRYGTDHVWRFVRQEPSSIKKRFGSSVRRKCGRSLLSELVESRTMIACAWPQPIAPTTRNGVFNSLSILAKKNSMNYLANRSLLQRKSAHPQNVNVLIHVSRIRKILLHTLILISSFLVGSNLNASTINFEDLTLALNTRFDGYGAGATTGSWQSGGASFNTNTFGPGWSYSNINDNTTAGFTNQWSAITGSGFGGSGIYAIANSGSPNGAVINLFAPSMLSSVHVTNSTYAALSMQNGDAFAKKFGGVSENDPDFFLLTFTGFSAPNASGSVTGSVDFFLADFRFENNSLDYIVDQWTSVDLTGLGAAHSIGLTLTGSDIGQFGLNTPAYVAIDNLVFVAIPEPSGGIVFAAGLTIVFRRRRRSLSVV